MKKLINIAFITLGFTAVSFAQNANDQNPNFEKSLHKYEGKKDLAGAEQSVTLHNTYKVEDWRDVKAEEQELKAERKHELRKMRIEQNARDRRYNDNSRPHNRRYNQQGNRYDNNRYPYNY